MSASVSLPELELVNLPDPQAWMADLCAELQAATTVPCTMGKLEKLIEQKTRELARSILRSTTRAVASRHVKDCPKCEQRLREIRDRPRSISSVFGEIAHSRPYGYCPKCNKWMSPSDQSLGLHARATASPRIQEICALKALESPIAQAQGSLYQLMGLDISANTLYREARRQGERAIELRDADAKLTSTSEGIAKLSARARAPEAPFTLIIEIDAWNIRERDHWGQSKEVRKLLDSFSRWHWVYTGTVFRLDQRGKTESGRSVITERGYVATREGLEAFESQLYAEALQRGLAQAQHVLVIADGAVWIWNLVDNRFTGARERLDHYHAVEHLWTVAHEMFGRNTEEGKEWVTPLIRWLQSRKDGALDVIETLKELRHRIEPLSDSQRETLDRELGYFDSHKDRMKYKEAKALGEPIGSGAIESTCSQYQCRFKRTGQFWSLEGDEVFLALWTLHRNGRWHLLFPHDQQQE